MGLEDRLKMLKKTKTGEPPKEAEEEYLKWTLVKDGFT